MRWMDTLGGEGEYLKGSGQGVCGGGIVWG